MNFSLSRSGSSPMSKVELRPGPDDDAKTATIIVGGYQVGEMWLTTRGACYKHIIRDRALDTEEMQTIVSAMQAAEVFGMGSDQ